MKSRTARNGAQAGGAMPSSPSSDDDTMREEDMNSNTDDRLYRLESRHDEDFFKSMSGWSHSCPNCFAPRISVFPERAPTEITLEQAQQIAAVITYKCGSDLQLYVRGVTYVPDFVFKCNSFYLPLHKCIF